MAMCICIGDLQNPITVEKLSPSATIDGSGNINEKLDANWTTAGKEWAKCVTRGSREFILGPQVKETSTHQWTIRFSKRASEYTTGMRLRMEGRKFNISGPPLVVDEKRQWIVIQTEEVGAV